jgi:PAS domain S-box-containing protein
MATDMNRQDVALDLLRQSEERFRALIQQSADAIQLLSAEGKVLYSSDSVERVLGYKPEELQGAVPEDHIHPDDFPGFMEKFRKLLQMPGGRDSHVYRVQHKNGSWVWIEATGSNYLHDPHIQAIVGNFRNITERKQAEERQRLLNEASEKLAFSLDQQITLQEIAQLIVPALADYCRIAILDEQQHIKEIAVNHIDPQKLALVRELYYQDKDRAGSTHGLQKVLQTGQPELISHVSDSERLSRIGQYSPELLTVINALGLTSYMGTPLIARGKVIGAITFSSTQPQHYYTPDDLAFAQELARRIAITLDNARLYQEAQKEIAVRKALEEQLLRVNKQLEAILKTIDDGILLQDASGKIVYANQAVARLSGYQSVDELLQVPALWYEQQFDLTDEYGQPFPTSRFPGRRVLAGESPAQEMVRIQQKGSSEVCWLLITSTAVLDGEGKPWAVMSVLHDITQFKEQEQRKDEFIAMASHELRTPLTSLKGFLYLLGQRLRKQEDQQALSYLDRVNHQVTRLTRLISDLLDISRMQTGQLEYTMEPFQLDALVHEVVETVQEGTATHRIQIEGQTRAIILGDRDRIGQVLINLLTNAIRYAPNTDKVIVRLSADPQNACVSVQDFGPGIAREHQQKIFERYYQISDPGHHPFAGLGIGLYLANEIIKRHHGSISVESAQGRGSTFTFTLPLRKH